MNFQIYAIMLLMVVHTKGFILGNNYCTFARTCNATTYKDCGLWGWGKCQVPKTYTCYYQSCCRGWAGTQCSKPICNTACVNGGTCISPDRCICPPSHTGDHCETSTTTTTSSSTLNVMTAMINETTNLKQNHSLNLSICRDKIYNCEDYGHDICSDYVPWANEHCRMFCGFCKGPSTTAQPCVDAIGNCQEYPPDICTSLSFVKWAKEHCFKFCKLCDDSSP